MEGQDGEKKSVTRFFLIYCALLTSWWLKDRSQEYINRAKNAKHSPGRKQSMPHSYAALKYLHDVLMTALLSCYFLIGSASPRSYLGLLNRTATSLCLSHNPQLSPAWSTSEAVVGAGPCQCKAPAQTNSAPAGPDGEKGSGPSQRLNFNPEKHEGKVTHLPRLS